MGQQLSQRSDLLRPEYCEALGELLDRVKSFAFKHTRVAIEKQLKYDDTSLEEVFSEINEIPIGSGSVACVYEAWLHDESERWPVHVVIKVRRPKIQELFGADLRALKIIIRILENSAWFRRGYFRSFLEQLAEILTDELDFTKEARYQELFRREYRKRKRYHVAAPKVFHRWSGKDVMVSEFVDAIPMTEVTRAIEMGDEQYLNYRRGLGITPVRLAKRLIRYSFHAFFEGIFFHGDPHPSNIFILPNNELVFVDFGACGTFSKRDRNLMLQMHQFHSQKDIRGMVQCVMALMEPLRGLSKDEFREKLTKLYWDGYYGLRSKESDWRDRTSYRLWISLFDVCYDFGVPLPSNMLRMIRATLLYDTVAAKLYNRINVFREFQKYERTLARRVRAQLIGDVARQALCGPDLHWYLSFQRVLDMGRTALYRVQKFLDEPLFNPHFQFDV